MVPRAQDSGIIESRSAGQAVVQMTRHNRCPEEYAVKFFAKRADFESEAALYRDQTCALFNFLPKV